jgi:GNAT superfamily N-acetyltransferase
MDRLFCDSRLAYRLELAHAWRGVRYVEAAARLFPTRNCVALAVGGGFALYAGPGSPVSRALALGMERSLSPDDLDQVQRFYNQHRAAARLDLCPLADPSLLELLGQRGYTVQGVYSVLAYPLTDQDLSFEAPEGVRVAQAAAEDVELWLHTVAQGFSSEEVPPADVLEMIAPTFRSENTASYLAWVDGAPAGGAAMVRHESGVELGSDSTRCEYRGRGVQQALIRFRLAAAMQAGCDLAMILTSPGTASQRNAERLGFRLMYTKATMVRHQACNADLS